MIYDEIYFYSSFFYFLFPHSRAKKPIFFELLDNTKTYNLSNCLSKFTDDATLQLKITEGDESKIQSFKILVFLDDNFSITYDDYNQFKQTQLIGLLNGNNAFQNYTSITFTIDVTLQNEEKVTQILKVCLENLESPNIISENIIASSGKEKK